MMALAHNHGKSTMAEKLLPTLLRIALQADKDDCSSGVDGLAVAEIGALFKRDTDMASW